GEEPFMVRRVVLARPMLRAGQRERRARRLSEKPNDLVALGEHVLDLGHPVAELGAVFGRAPLFDGTDVKSTYAVARVDPRLRDDPCAVVERDDDLLLVLFAIGLPDRARFCFPLRDALASLRLRENRLPTANVIRLPTLPFDDRFSSAR